MSADYVYRLEIEYPDGVDWLHPPKEWLNDLAEWGAQHDEVTFWWPPERRFLSKRAAQKRADRLTRYGCTVELQRATVGEWEVTP